MTSRGVSDGDDDALAIVCKIATDPRIPVHIQIEAKDACAERDVPHVERLLPC
jgi:hypothetical protein